MLWIFAARFFMAALRQCEKSEGCFAVFTAQPWTAAVLFKLQFSDGLLERSYVEYSHALAGLEDCAPFAAQSPRRRPYLWLHYQRHNSHSSYARPGSSFHTLGRDDQL